MSRTPHIKRLVDGSNLIALLSLAMAGLGALNVSAQSVQLPEKSAKVLRLERQILDQQEELARYTISRKHIVCSLTC